MSQSGLRPLGLGLITAAFALGAAACGDEDPVVVLNNGEPVQNFAVIAGPGPLPGGTFQVTETREVTVGGATIEVPSALEATLSSLHALQGGAYELWLVNRSTGAARAATGEITVDDGAPTTGNSVPGSGDAVYTVRVSDATVGDAVADYTDLVVRFGEQTPIWFRYVNHNNAPGDPASHTYTNSGSFSFGAFDPAGPQPFGISGFGRGGTYLDSVIVHIQRMSPPPAGYQYQGWLFNTRTGASAATSVLELDELGDGFDRIGESAIQGQFSDYDTYLISLQPLTGAASLAPTRVQLSEEGTYADALERAGKL